MAAISLSRVTVHQLLTNQPARLISCLPKERRIIFLLDSSVWSLQSLTEPLHWQHVWVKLGIMISILLVDLWITKTFQNCTLTQDTLRRQPWYMWNWSLSIPSIELLDISVYLGVLSQRKLHKLKRSSKELTVDAPDQLTDCIIWTNWSLQRSDVHS